MTPSAIARSIKPGGAAHEIEVSGGIRINGILARFRWVHHRRRRFRQDLVNDRAANEPGCVSLAQWYISAHLDFARAKILLEQSCGTGYPEACAKLAYYLLVGFTPTDPKRAQDLLRYACDRNVAEGCHNLACTWEDKKDLVAANPAHEKACLLGDMESCEIAGWHLSAGDVVHVDEARAFKYLTLACDAARPVACAEARHILRHGSRCAEGSAARADLVRSSLSRRGSCRLPVARVDLPRRQGGTCG